ncbi:hypothetical protein HUW46_08154 [Amycolatopsis sp. CA-230715]|nr:hypothetical protein HUW46_08154 [Amycolatopsis sp. CA-230715]
MLPPRGGPAQPGVYPLPHGNLHQGATAHALPLPGDRPSIQQRDRDHFHRPAIVRNEENHTGPQATPGDLGLETSLKDLKAAAEARRPSTVDGAQNAGTSLVIALPVSLFLRSICQSESGVKISRKLSNLQELVKPFLAASQSVPVLKYTE